jgi:hypothetical protein
MPPATPVNSSQSPGVCSGNTGSLPHYSLFID